MVHASELVDGVITTVDITKLNPYRENTQIEFDEDGNLSNTVPFGYSPDRVIFDVLSYPRC